MSPATLKGDGWRQPHRSHLCAASCKVSESMQGSAVDGELVHHSPNCLAQLGVEVPHQDGMIQAGRYDLLPIRAEGQLLDSTGMTLADRRHQGSTNVINFD